VNCQFKKSPGSSCGPDLVRLGPQRSPLFGLLVRLAISKTERSLLVKVMVATNLRSVGCSENKDVTVAIREECGHGISEFRTSDGLWDRWDIPSGPYGISMGSPWDIPRDLVWDPRLKSFRRWDRLKRALWADLLFACSMKAATNSRSLAKNRSGRQPQLIVAVARFPAGCASTSSQGTSEHPAGGGRVHMSLCGFDILPQIKSSPEGGRRSFIPKARAGTPASTLHRGSPHSPKMGILGVRSGTHDSLLGLPSGRILSLSGLMPEPNAAIV
jgi:hypothetical protein